MATLISLFQNFLDAFTEAADSPYGCLFVHGKVAVATKKWWSLAAKELVLISMFLSSLIPCSSRDMPVFLPVVSPTVGTSLSRDMPVFWESILQTICTQSSLIRVHSVCFHGKTILECI